MADSKDLVKSTENLDIHRTVDKDGHPGFQGFAPVKNWNPLLRQHENALQASIPILKISYTLVCCKCGFETQKDSAILRCASCKHTPCENCKYTQSDNMNEIAHNAVLAEPKPLTLEDIHEGGKILEAIDSGVIFVEERTGWTEDGKFIKPTEEEVLLALTIACPECKADKQCCCTFVSMIGVLYDPLVHRVRINTARDLAQTKECVANVDRVAAALSASPVRED